MLPNAQLKLVPACDIGSILKESLWLISGSLWLTYLLTKSLLGSQGPCSARSGATALHDFHAMNHGAGQIPGVGIGPAP